MGDIIKVPPGGGGAEEFIELTDAPSSYSGQALKLVRVNAGATALEFSASPVLYSRVIDYISTAGDTCSNSSFEDITDMNNVAVNIPVTGLYKCRISWVAVSAAGLCVPSITVNNSANEVDNGKLFLASVGQALQASGEELISLTAGTVNFRPQWRRSAGGSAITVDSLMTWSISITGPFTELSLVA